MVKNWGKIVPGRKETKYKIYFTSMKIVYFWNSGKHVIKDSTLLTPITILMGCRALNNIVGMGCRGFSKAENKIKFICTYIRYMLTIHT